MRSAKGGLSIELAEHDFADPTVDAFVLRTALSEIRAVAVCLCTEESQDFTDGDLARREIGAHAGRTIFGGLGAGFGVGGKLG